MIYAVVAMVVVGYFGGYSIARVHYEPLLADANKQIGTLITANYEMKASVDKQNGAITEMQADAKRREQIATVAVQQAHKLAVKSQTRAQEVLLLKQPTGVNQCTAAQAAFDDELKDERGVK